MVVGVMGSCGRECMMRRGQVSVEAMVSFIVLLLVMVFVYFQLGEMQYASDFTSSSAILGNDCVKLQAAISMVRNSSADSWLQVFISGPAVISGNMITFENNYCYFNGQQISASLSAGNILVKKTGGVISVENA